ncbi:peptidylprolyl isomerase [Actinosynnema sp. NPDC059335]|uniref:peptidylprolyl isomerase n=1 Tax=Actinosynnema sp. NPDC059335 TaxID=3346804 RepID=UPI00366EAE1B
MPTNVQRREQAKRKLERQLVRRAERAKRRRIIAVVATAVTVVVVAGGVYFLATADFGSTGDDAAGASSTTPAPIQIPTEVKALPTRPTPIADPATCEYRPSKEPASKEGTKAPEGSAPATGTATATIKANIGELKLTLDRALAPCAVNSFINLAKQGYYDGSTCHRIGTEGLQMLQCGDPTGTGTGGPGYTFDNETWPELTYGRGYLAMANAGLDQETQKGTNGSQFFIVYGDAQLSPDYTVFGSIDEAGLKLIDDVARAGHDGSFDPSPGGGKPNKEVKFESVTVA